jgi:hypothetical protein
MTHATKGIYRYIMQDFIRVRSCVPCLSVFPALVSLVPVIVPLLIDSL